MDTAQGFWSYVHKDNDGMHGTIVRLAEHVEDEYGVITGGLELDLFLDNMKLKWGDKWRLQIREAIESTTFFIPIITPRYFKSGECRSELLGFAEQAEELGLSALIMPLYFVEVPELETGNFGDPAMKLVADSQMKDWRTLRFLDETTQPYRLAVSQLADRLIEVSREREGSTPTEPRPSDDDEEDGQAGSGTTPAPQVRREPEPEESSGEGGTLELLVEGEDAFPRIVATLNNISPEIEKVGELASAAAKEVHQSDEKGKGFKGRLVVTSRLSKNLKEPADRLEKLTSEYVADLVVVDPAIRQMIRLAGEQSATNPQEVAEFFSSIEGMVDSSEEATGSIEGMIESLNESSELSRELNIPIKRLRTSLQSLADGYRLMEVWRNDIKNADQS